MECVVLKRLCLSGPRPKTLSDFDVEMKPSWLILKGRIRPARIHGFRPEGGIVLREGAERGYPSTGLSKTSVLPKPSNNLSTVARFP